MEACLFVLNGPNAGALIKLGEENLIGRSPECFIHSNDPTVSRKHCRILRESLRFVLEDLGSLNDTALNGRNLTSPSELKDGDKINAAAIEFKFLLGCSASDQVPPDKNPTLKYPDQYPQG